MSNSICSQCPRACRVDRSKKRGFCNTGEQFAVSKVSLHPWEEPVLCGEKGAGTVFFSGCNLRCVYCQNREISRGGVGSLLSPEELEQKILRLQDLGAGSIDLVTPTHFALQLVPVLQRVKPKLRIPVVYNCGGYESVESLKRLEGLVDIYLPDCKYVSSELSEKYSSAPDYFDVCMKAIEEMLRQTGKPSFGENVLKKGTVVRHLILPGCRKDSIAVLHALFDRFGSDAFLLSLMSQYTPDFASDAADPNLHRRLTSFEADSVLKVAKELGFDGFCQGLSSAKASFTPDFSAKTV